MLCCGVLCGVLYCTVQCVGWDEMQGIVVSLNVVYSVVVWCTAPFVLQCYVVFGIVVLCGVAK